MEWEQTPMRFAPHAPPDGLSLAAVGHYGAFRAVTRSADSLGFCTCKEGEGSAPGPQKHALQPQARTARR